MYHISVNLAMGRREKKYLGVQKSFYGGPGGNTISRRVPNGNVTPLAGFQNNRVALKGVCKQFTWFWVLIIHFLNDNLVFLNKRITELDYFDEVEY